MDKSLTVLLLAFLHTISSPLAKELKVLTMNMWGIELNPFARSARMWPLDDKNSKDRKQRMIGAAETIKAGNYDFVMLQEVWDDGDSEVFKSHLGHEFYMTEHAELAGNCLDRRRKKRSLAALRKGQHQRFLSMLGCSGLHIVSKYHPSANSTFTPFDDIGTMVIDCPNLECMTQKGVGNVRFHYPLDDKRHITVDVFNIHTQSDPNRTGEQRRRRLNQLNQVLPAIESSDADLVLLGGDFNDHQKSSVYQRMTKKLTDPAVERFNESYYFQSPDFHTYGHRHNYYTYKTKDDFRRTLDYILYRKPKKNADFSIKVKDFRIPHHVRYDSNNRRTFSLSDHEQVEVIFELTSSRRV